MVGTKEDRIDFPVVGVGASGNVTDLLTAFFHNIPAQHGMAFVIVLHRTRARNNQMTRIIQRMTPMLVTEITEGMAIEPDSVYVVPSDTIVTLAGGVMHLRPREPGHAPPDVIDQFFSSLANDRGRLAIGIVLSGGLRDGTRGLRDIKAAGGVTFAQDLESATSAEMPRSAISAGHVDFVMPPDEIIHQLLKMNGALRR